MFNAKVYKIAVFSLSGIMEETFAAKETIRKWNEANAESTGRLYLLVDNPKTSDKVVGIIGNWLGNKTIVEDSLTAGKQVLLFFNAYADPNNTIASEQQTVLSFKESMNGRCFIAEYNGVQELKGLIVEQLDKIQQA